MTNELEVRVAKLERENRWMKRGGAVAALVAGALVLMGAGKKPEVHQELRARSFILVDEKDVTAGVFGRANGRSILMVGTGTEPSGSFVAATTPNDVTLNVGWRKTENTSTFSVRSFDKWSVLSLAPRGVAAAPVVHIGALESGSSVTIGEGRDSVGLYHDGKLSFVSGKILPP